MLLQMLVTCDVVAGARDVRDKCKLLRGPPAGAHESGWGSDVTLLHLPQAGPGDESVVFIFQEPQGTR